MGDDPGGRPQDRAIAALKRLVALANALLGMARLLMILSLVAGLWCWLAVFVPFGLSLWSGSVAVVTLLLVLTPGAVLMLFYLGLLQVRNAPARIDELRLQGMDSARQLASSVQSGPQVKRVGRPLQLLRTLWELRSLADEATGFAFEVLAILRLANPATAVAVAASLAVAALLALAAATVTLVRLI